MEKKEITAKRRQQLRAARDKYNAKTYQKMNLSIRKDSDIYIKLQNVSNKQEYIRKLIEEDIKKNGLGE